MVGCLIASMPPVPLSPRAPSTSNCDCSVVSGVGLPFQLTEPPASMRMRIGSGGVPGCPLTILADVDERVVLAARFQCFQLLDVDFLDAGLRVLNEILK